MARPDIPQSRGWAPTTVGAYNGHSPYPSGAPMHEPVRLAKRVVALAQCSRREAEQYIEGGWVRVDGEVVEAPQRMVASEVVTLDPAATLTPTEPATLLLHQPSGVASGAAGALIAADTRWAGDASGLRPLKRHLHRLNALLPLPDGASGLLIFTQDWRVRRKLTEDAERIEQEFVVEVAGEIAPNGLALLNHGLRFNNYAMPPIKVSWQSEQRLRFAFKLLQPSQIRPMCAAVGLTVLAMKRLRVGRIPLAGMPPGQWRYLATAERI